MEEDWAHDMVEAYLLPLWIAYYGRNSETHFKNLRATFIKSRSPSSTEAETTARKNSIQAVEPKMLFSQQSLLP
jgi:hypothetical protein